VPPLRVRPVDLRDQNVFLLVVSSVFAVLGVLLVAIRNASFGRRLTAMKDSPAATATLGQRLVLLKLSVFAGSTAIAGLGGVLMSMAVTSVAMETFGLTVSLALVMLTVVAGIGYVSGALVGGLIAGAGSTAVVLLLNRVATEHPDYAGSLTLVSHLVLVSVALVGISVAKNPSGFLHDLFAGHRRLAEAPRIRYAAVVVQVALYTLAWFDVIGTALLVLLSAALWFTLPGIGTALRAVNNRGAARAIPAALVGVDETYPPDLAIWLDRELGIRPMPAAAPPARRRADGVEEASRVAA
jgi:branched-subunit amino acid ABC-type transport system permease component